jgi:F-box/leucine-rich repeat protein 2/20
MTSRSSTAGNSLSATGRIGKRPPTDRSKILDSYMHSRSTVGPVAIKVSSPVQLQYIFDEQLVTFPKKLLFRDFLCKVPLQSIDLRGWTVSNHIFEVIRDECPEIKVLHVDDVNGLTAQCFETIRGLKQLRNLSLQRIVNCPITLEIAHCVASFKLLKYLNMNDCSANTEVFQALSQSCSNVRTLHVARCKGLDSSGLHAIAQWIQRFRKLQIVDFSGCEEITDDGVLDVFVAGFNILVEVNLSQCRGLSTTALTGTRTKMPEFRKLDISHMALGNTVYEWLTEGCRNLTHLNLANSPELDDAGLARIGRWCRQLLSISISECLGITDYGVSGFFKQFYGALEAIDMSNCVQLGSECAVTLSRHAKALKELKLNGLSRLEPASLTLLWGAATSLVHFEMCSNLSTTTTHRKSSMPHFSDTVLAAATNMPAATLRYIKLTGSFKVTNSGACVLARACTALLHIDVSYCNSIGDPLLLELAAHAIQLKALVTTGCIAVTSAGIVAISQGQHTDRTFHAYVCLRV